MRGTPTSRPDARWAYAPGVTQLDPATAGFWRSILRASYAGCVWAKVEAAIRAGWLAPAARLSASRDGRRYELRVYVRDVREEAALRRVRALMRRELGFVRPLACYDWGGRKRWCDPSVETTTPAPLRRRHRTSDRSARGERGGA